MSSHGEDQQSNAERRKPYQYADRGGMYPVSWDDMHGICKALAIGVAPWRPELILAVARGGYYPGALLAHMLQVDIYPVKLSRRVNDVVTHGSPQWYIRPPEAAQGQRVLIVDEIIDTGETVQMVKSEAERLGASEVRIAALYAHSRGATVPDYIGLISDALILNPWDREILKDGAFQFHPEYVGALAEQGLTPTDAMRIPATSFELAKGAP